MIGREMYYTTNDALGKPETRKIINEAIYNAAEKLCIYYAKEYEQNPKNLMNCFIKYPSIRMAACLIIFTTKHSGLYYKLKGKKDFSEWANKQSLEEKWKPVLANFLLILWGCINES